MGAVLHQGAIRAGAVAAIVSGIPSTIYELSRGNDPLESTRAIGSMVTNSEDESTLLLAAVPVHMAVSLWWAIVITRVLPARKRLVLSGLLGAAIALFDLRVVGHRFPRIRALPLGPQIADHVMFGIVVAALTQPVPLTLGDPRQGPQFPG